MKIILTKKALDKLLTQKEFSVYGKVIVGSVCALFVIAVCYSVLLLITFAAEAFSFDAANFLGGLMPGLLAFLLGFWVAKVK